MVEMTRVNSETLEAARSVLSIAYKQMQSTIVSPPRVKDTSKQVDWAALVPILRTTERLVHTFEDLIGAQSDKWAIDNAGADIHTEYDNIQFWMVLLRSTLTSQGKLSKVRDNPQA